jgi:hypothetical protein
MIKGTVVRVGNGRGFVVEGERSRFVITAAHCLPLFPPCATISYLEERTYESLIGIIGEEPTVWAECLFADPVGDIAVLGPPDDQELSDQAAAYHAMLDEATPFKVRAADAEESAWMLSLGGRWFLCKVERQPNGPLWVTSGKTVGGMSGSPICAEDGTAIGVLCAGGDSFEGPNPALPRNLPVWLWRELEAASAA